MEPNPRLARQLRGAVAKNQLTRVSVVEAALGAAQGSAVLSCPAENSGISKLVSFIFVEKAL